MSGGLGLSEIGDAIRLTFQEVSEEFSHSFLERG